MSCRSPGGVENRALTVGSAHAVEMLKQGAGGDAGVSTYVKIGLAD